MERGVGQPQVDAGMHVAPVHDSEEAPWRRRIAGLSAHIANGFSWTTLKPKKQVIP